MNATTSTVPPHVPPELVFDFDLYNVPGVEEDYQLALKRLHDQGRPGHFLDAAQWRPLGGHARRRYVRILRRPRTFLFAHADRAEVEARAAVSDLSPTRPITPLTARCSRRRSRPRRSRGWKARHARSRSSWSKSCAPRPMRVHRRLRPASADRSLHGHRRSARGGSHDAAGLGGCHGASGYSRNAACR